MFCTSAMLASPVVDHCHLFVFLFVVFEIRPVELLDHVVVTAYVLVYVLPYFATRSRNESSFVDEGAFTSRNATPAFPQVNAEASIAAFQAAGMLVPIL